MVPLEEVSQGKRLLLAMLVFFTVVPILGAVLMIPGAIIFTYLVDGWPAVLNLRNTWATPPNNPDYIYKVGVGFVAFVSVGIPGFFWYKIFIKSGYISKETEKKLDAGHWPVVGGGWKPVVLIAFLFFCLWAAVESYMRGIWFFFMLMIYGVFIFVKMIFQEYLRIKNKLK